MKDGDQTFVKISNKDIYDQIKTSQKTNEEQHNEIIKRLDVTNGKVKLGKWLATTSLMLALMAMGWFLAHVS